MSPPFVRVEPWVRTLLPVLVGLDIVSFRKSRWESSADLVDWLFRFGFCKRVCVWPCDLMIGFMKCCLDDIILRFLCGSLSGSHTDWALGDASFPGYSTVKEY